MAASGGSNVLSQLAALEQVRVTQEARPVLRGTKFTVRTEAGDELFTVKEEGLVLNGRTRHLPVYDPHGLEVMHLRIRFCCRGVKMQVLVQGEIVAVVRQKLTWFRFLLHINDTANQPHYRIRGVLWPNPRGNIEFELQTADKRPVGVVRKVYAGFRQEFFTRLDNYELRFPADMDVRFKASVIGACVLIDYLLFQRR